ncbi:MAG: hypothetical protein AB7C92_07440 [Synergistaceae bacterium]
MSRQFNCKACGGVHYSMPELQECHRKHKELAKKELEKTPEGAPKLTTITPEILAAKDCLFVLPPEICPEELGYLSSGQYAELRIRGFMSRKGFEVDTIEHSR